MPTAAVAISAGLLACTAAKAGLIPRTSVPRIVTMAHQVDANDAESAEGAWQTLSSTATISSPWLTVHCERLLDTGGQTLDYWRVERASSAVVLTIHQDHLVFPRPQYRPGVGRVTLDFAGGRVPRAEEGTDEDATAAAWGILERELGLADARSAVRELRALNSPACGGWAVDSSFSSQRLFGFVATLSDGAQLDGARLHPRRYDVRDAAQMEALLWGGELRCLQCRAVLMEWLLSRASRP